MELTRRDVILACIAAFIAWGHLTHWAPSLRYVPQAFLAGVAITVAGIVYLIASTSRSPELALARPLRAPQHVAFVSPQAWRAETASLKSRALYRREPLYPPSFVISDHLDNLLDLILRDFVQTWYGAISPRPTFTNEVDRAIRAALGNIRDRLLEADLVEIAISRAVPMVTTHMRDFYEAERIVRGRKLSRDVTESDELDNAIAAKYRDGKLHPAASLTYTNPKSVQQQHLRGIVARLMPQVLPRTMRTSQTVNTLIKEIVACAVLFPVIQMLADPDTWNQMMEGYGRALLQDRKTVRKLRAALDEHAPVSPKLPKTAPFPRLAPGDNERNFERFIRAIRQCNSLSDARRFRKNANLRHVLYDASGLSYFMEFMDRQGLMRLVQFWIVVDGFRDPLEEDTGETDDASLELSWGASERADLAQIYEGYLTKPELAAPDNLRRIVDDFLRAGKRATSIQYLAARRAVLQVQSLVYHEMADRYFARFKKPQKSGSLNLGSEEHQDAPELVNQESIVDSLTKKAELTNNAAELRILKKSKASLQREIHRKELQRQQYVIQESDNSLYGRATVSIQSIMVGKDEAGSEFALYVIERAISPSDPSDSQAETKDFVSRIYSSVSDGMEEFIGNIPVLDQLSLAGQNLISAATTQLNNGNGAAGIGPAAAATSAIANDPQAAAEAEAELRAYENQQLEPFIKPICDLFLEVFELNRENNWLRGRAVVVVLHQLLGGTIERKVRENVKVLTQEDNIVKYIGTLRDSMWPPANGGQMVRDKPPRTEGEKAKSRKEAGLMLATLIPDLAGSVVGRANAQAASRRILATLNNQRLNTHLVYSLLDEIVQIIFGV
ncbi:putative intermediate filament protein [Neofusicoccum parvum UCRNP2]|uniref:Putative intermediate filament protein n=1 Tax=Botryosphaeria parva (strain UCR-NP2) TaxID=1287680 RepID=R1ET41_BOTPV|nr:putative intermediate filament protein [Neofusicoccum parvum UCRNP2]